MLITILLRRHLVGLLSHHVTRVVACNLMFSPAAAEDISWSSNFLVAVNEDSAGASMDAQFTFFLGAFAPPPPSGGEPVWTPGPGNTSEWAEHWVTADAISYNTLTSNFSSGYDVEPSVEGVSLTGKQGYIWGVNRAHPDAEWILITDPSWVYPAPGSGGVGGFGANWTVDGSVAVLGQVDVGGVHMKTAAVSGALPPLMKATIWQQAHFSAVEIASQEETVSGWLADPNRNGRPNLLEYAFGTNPRARQYSRRPVRGFMGLEGEDYQTLTISLDPNTEALVSAEVTSDLLVWESAPSGVVLESQSAGVLVFRDLTPLGGHTSFRGIRAVVELP